MRRILFSCCLWSALLLLSQPTRAQTSPASGAVAAPPSAAHRAHAFQPPSPYAAIDPARYELQRELMYVETELTLLRAGRPRLGLPITMIIAGAQLGVIFTAAAIVHAVDSRRYEYRWDARGNRSLHLDYDETARAEMRPVAVLAALCWTVAGGGAALLARRVKVRREQKPRITPLQDRRRELLHRLGYALNVDRRQLHVGAKLTF